METQKNLTNVFDLSECLVINLPLANRKFVYY